MNKEKIKFLSKAIIDLENRMYDRLERAKNEIEILEAESIEELKEISRLVKKLK